MKQLQASSAALPASLRERQDRYGSLVRRLRNVQVLAAVLLLLDVGATAALVHQLTNPRVRLYVVELDRFGRPRSLGPAPETSRRDRMVIRSLLADWIWHARTVTSDRVLQSTFLRRAQSYTAGKARAELVESLREKRNPYELVREKTVEVHFESALPLDDGEEKWEVVWVEEHRRHLGGVSEEKWRALVTIDWDVPDEEEALSLNPLGLQIEILNWTRVGRSEKEGES